MPSILIVEDDRNTLSGLVEILEEEGYEVKGVDSGPKALRILERERFDILLTDLKMPEIDGMQLYEQSQTLAPEMKTIVMTAYSSVKEAVDAMKRGVYEYLTKPLNLDELFVILRKALEDQNLRREYEELKDRLQVSYRFESIIGKSPAMQQVFKTIYKVAKSQATVLIRGESGTGKELVARAIHYNSPRANGPMVEISCAAFPETLLESELFGYEKGAFTGADTRKKGRFELAQGGTIFLDEIGDISASVQTKLLRVLQEKEISRLGSNESIKVDVRVITATNRDLEQALNSGQFREDLYYRLNVIPLFLPPLRERREDIPLLIDHFIKRYSRLNNKPMLSISAEALELCLNYNWPGNVRELENAIENAIVLGEGEILLPEHLPVTLAMRKAATESYVQPGVDNLFATSGTSYREKMEAAEKLVLEEAIRRAGGNKSEAAKQLGISLRTMRYKIQKYNL
ncbi:MAG: sigma-54 dependent transcriptional regulator [candidate division KSB1 bacterium]|nr:sigma-54 dependent transcriptional regulator [candidate division KSB1 bacterium]MDZ7305140.1 sigma-54 dependent transcriptional regulator [candidate division KSB1 bacterium]MDZ7314224.1 sigma-54 dependent transcriptional regulator [candidate division KSB1 bacterium]